jgi:SRSO17 transposase
MTEQEIAELGPAFATYLGRYRRCFLQKRTAGHFDTDCRGLLSDLPRKSVEPIASAWSTRNAGSQVHSADDDRAPLSPKSSCKPCRAPRR